MDQYKRILDLPSDYFNVTPYSKRQMLILLKKKGKKKKSFANDSELKNYMIKTYCEIQIDFIISSLDNKDIRDDLLDYILGKKKMI